tara:strand:+ start:76 stop:729 length:654 start_codon:yes stop_codon:yes gene_type:complete
MLGPALALRCMTGLQKTIHKGYLVDYREELQKHYSNCKDRKGQGATKDIVGRSYEKLRAEWIKHHPGLDVATPQERAAFAKSFGNKYNADQYIVDRKSRRLLALEEDKGHYVDKCFAKRVLCNVTEVIHHCLKNEMEIPYILVSCPTNYQFDSLLGVDTFFADLPYFDIIKEKFKFFNTCEHGRTSHKKYLKENEMPFEVNEDNVAREKKFLISLGE